MCDIKYYSEITDICDKYLNDKAKSISKSLDLNLANYIMYWGTYNGITEWVIRFPGATRGKIVVDKNDIIKEICIYDDIYDTNDIYEEGLDDELQKFVGTKLKLKVKEE